MTAHVRILEPDLEELNGRIHASLMRVLEQAPIENRLAVFGLMAKSAAKEVAARKQQVVDDLWFVANAVGLVDLLGVTSVQHSMSLAFEPFELRAQP
jgi:hypothetical protein